MEFLQAFPIAIVDEDFDASHATTVPALG